ncbi:small nuclear ribonucleoprotein F [Nematocida sp. LUAm3]|nr:small nuclear ribonucleoprotein F [Nematocida sp. LUAm3]KAI5175613.1 small nuclear ribonucleoprotein F [Nematocida sp. LUAm2]KAI5178519.1 small nuclear ribonucleoprotein F [Nematocida sp. LUAm1]
MTPSMLLEELQNKSVTIHLKWKDSYTGYLVSFDKYLNIHLKDAKKNRSQVGDVVIRCNNILYLHENV